MDEKTRLYRIVRGIANALLMTEDYSVCNQESQLNGISKTAHRIVSNAGFDTNYDEVKEIVKEEVYDDYWQIF